jgi:hypothetical protein
VRTPARRPSGPPPLPRVAINPAFYHAVRTSGFPIYRITTIVGATHPALISRLIGSDSVPASDINIERLERIAEIVGYDKAQIFLDGGVGEAGR